MSLRRSKNIQSLRVIQNLSLGHVGGDLDASVNRVLVDVVHPEVLVALDGLMDPALNVAELDRFPEKSGLLRDLQLDLDFLFGKVITEKRLNIVSFIFPYRAANR